MSSAKLFERLRAALGEDAFTRHQDIGSACRSLLGLGLNHWRSGGDVSKLVALIDRSEPETVRTLVSERGTVAPIVALLNAKEPIEGTRELLRRFAAPDARDRLLLVYNDGESESLAVDQPDVDNGSDVTLH